MGIVLDGFSKLVFTQAVGRGMGAPDRQQGVGWGMLGKVEWSYVKRRLIAGVIHTWRDRRP